MIFNNQVRRQTMEIISYLESLVGIEGAKRVTETYSPISSLLQATDRELQISCRLSPLASKRLIAAIELGRVLLSIPLVPGTVLSSSSLVYDAYRERVKGLQHEEFFVLLTDTKLRLIKEIRISQGSLNFSVVHPREVFKTAIREAAEGVILVHNHPSGDVIPSREDIELTKRMVEAGEIIGIKVKDHLIIGHDCYYSMLEHNMLRGYEGREL
jgi:DNA repair protein RadC